LFDASDWSKFSPQQFSLLFVIVIQEVLQAPASMVVWTISVKDVDDVGFPVELLSNVHGPKI
jgi:hypothetical protein